MPYIEEKHRERITLKGNNGKVTIFANEVKTPGELNFAVTELIKVYISQHVLDYQAINDVMGALEGAKAEFYRRVASLYENHKILKNGDVYDR